MAGGVVGRRGQNEQWVRDNRTTTYATLMREFTKVEIELREAFIEDRPNRLDWAPWNAALVALSLVATREVAAAAWRLTDAVGRFALLVDRSPKTREDLQEIHGALAAAQLAFVNAARRSLDSSQQSLDLQLGGPPPWREVEPYAPAPSAGEPA
ncbi:hypothetical protein AB0O76_17210 [Streptomyces sp. NPDC086554]|uniref:hypothetical protein n=1 Tax=Streptomyces sp. NPDC086554 TaxID=3154864 RepID=UPI0034492A84